MVPRFQKGKSTKTDKTDKKLNHLSFQSTEQLKNNTFLTGTGIFPGKWWVLIADRQMPLV
jgi:hypothetical protein